MISAALLFHSFTSPLASMPKIGAFAVSMKVCSSLRHTRHLQLRLLALRHVLPHADHAQHVPLTSLRVVAFSSTSTRR